MHEGGRFNVLGESEEEQTEGTTGRWRVERKESQGVVDWDGD